MVIVDTIIIIIINNIQKFKSCHSHNDTHNDHYDGTKKDHFGTLTKKIWKFYKFLTKNKKQWWPKITAIEKFGQLKSSWATTTIQQKQQKTPIFR